MFHRVFPSNIPTRFSAPDKSKIVKLAQCVDKPKAITTYGYQLRSPVTLLQEMTLATFGYEIGWSLRGRDSVTKREIFS